VISFLATDGYLSSIAKDTVVINITTITPKAAERLQKLHEDIGVHYIAGPVSMVEAHSGIAC
jgi:3-hydroxyisobutyrate dehydrogenase-like beta-hydroxyacid dehydrogenase